VGSKRKYCCIPLPILLLTGSLSLVMAQQIPVEAVVKIHFMPVYKETSRSKGLAVVLDKGVTIYIVSEVAVESERWCQITMGIQKQTLGYAVCADLQRSMNHLQPQAHVEPGQEKYAPLPEKVVRAKTVFYVNDTSSSRFGDDLFQELKKWNRWQMIGDRTRADLILVLSQRDHIEGTIATATATTNGNSAYATGLSVPIKSSSWHIFLIDPTNGETLWVSSHTLGGRLWQSWGSVARSLLSDIQKRIR
jgi:hypothetical protein